MQGFLINHFLSLFEKQQGSLPNLSKEINITIYSINFERDESRFVLESNPGQDISNYSLFDLELHAESDKKVIVQWIFDVKPYA